MHYQIGGPQEDKYIYALTGSAYLVTSNAHKLRNGEYLQNQYFELSADKNQTLLVPSGLATGWISVTDNLSLVYMMTSRFEDCEYSGFRFNDPLAKIQWPVDPLVISEKDQKWPNL